VPDCLHHPVVGLKLRPDYSHLKRQNGGFSYSLRVSGLVFAGDKSAFARPSLHRKFPFPAWGGDRFDDWLVGLQFEPDHLHHPAFSNRTFPIGSVLTTLLCSASATYVTYCCRT
jgi:hypothetical protein